jgi:Fe-S-cluster containining protein
MSGDPKPQRDHCVRCGECCLKASPTLQREDIALVFENRITPADLYTIRVGELVRDNVNGELRTTDVEIVKVREQEGSDGCAYFQESAKACGIYPHRPSQCVALKCWDPTDFMEVYAGEKAARKDLVRDPALLGLMERHDAECSYEALEGHVASIREEGEKAVERIIRILKFDHNLRPLVTQRLGVGPNELSFYFGRPLTDTLVMFGLKVTRQPDGTFFLTALP